MRASRARWLSGFVGSALVFACAEPDDGSTASTSDGATATNDGTDATSTASDGTDGDSATSTSGPETSTASSTTADPSATCDGYCNKLVECIPDEVPSPGPCLDQCASVFERGDDACDAAASAYFSCVGDLECEAFYGPVAFCSDEEEAMAATCGRG